MFYTTLVLVTGPIWARPIWGVWWTWDPRLTMTVVLWAIYAALPDASRLGGEGRHDPALRGRCSASSARSTFRLLILAVRAVARRTPRRHAQRRSRTPGSGPDDGLDARRSRPWRSVCSSPGRPPAHGSSPSLAAMHLEELKRRLHRGLDGDLRLVRRRSVAEPRGAEDSSRGRRSSLELEQARSRQPVVERDVRCRPRSRTAVR